VALIVVIDDEYLLAMFLADILEDEGHEVVLAHNGQFGLERIREQRPALVITDFMMPLMTGLELAEAVKADDSISEIPIILVSGAQGYIARERPDLFQAVLDKPFHHDDMLREVRNLLGPGDV